MKATLLLIATLLASVTMSSVQAQAKVWNVGNDPTNFPVSAGIGAGPDVSVYKDGLGIHTGTVTTANMGAVEANAKTFTSPTTSVEYSFINRFKFNGSGYAGAVNTDVTPSVFVPTQRFLTISVGGNSTIYAIGITGSNNNDRKIFVTDGEKLIGSMAFGGSALVENTVEYTGPSATLYLFCNAAVNLYYLSATGVATSINSQKSNKIVVSEQIFDISGREVTSRYKGMVIKKQIYDDGSVASVKSILNKVD